MDIQFQEGIRRYLLCQSSSQDTALVEERFLTDSEFYQELLVVEDELIDQYLAGQLTDSEKQSFETHFLATPVRREKLRFARNLGKYIRLTAESGSSRAVTDPAFEPDARLISQFRSRLWPQPLLSYSLAAAAVLVLAFVAVMIIRNLNAPRQGPTKVLAVELLPGLSRSEGGLKLITVTPDTTTVELQLRIPNDLSYQMYRAILQTNAGREISRHNDLRSEHASKDRVICPVSAQLLPPGDYDLKLSGFNQPGDYEDVARYSFRVRRY